MFGVSILCVWEYSSGFRLLKFKSCRSTYHLCYLENVTYHTYHLMFDFFSFGGVIINIFLAYLSIKWNNLCRSLKVGLLLHNLYGLLLKGEIILSCGTKSFLWETVSFSVQVWIFSIHTLKLLVIISRQNAYDQNVWSKALVALTNVMRTVKETNKNLDLLNIF